MVDISITGAAPGDALLGHPGDEMLAGAGCGNLPTPLSSFVGRHQDTERALEALRGSRLVTLVGLGGVGKTRLAVRVATCSKATVDGTWFVDLAPVSDPELVVHAVASALSLREEPPQDLVHTVIGHLRLRHALIVLDNCEHLLPACARLADAIVRSCPDVAILATSRGPLGLTGEAVLKVCPLPVPDAGTSDPSAIARSEAVQLFLERTASLRPEFRFDDVGAPAVAEICRRLEGIPLAVELAAARMQALSPVEILANLEDRLGFLRNGDPAAPTRHHTLDAALGWSHELLSPEERALFGRLSVFSGTFSAEVVEHLGRAFLPGQDVVRLLESLVSKSLLVAEITSVGARFRLLETVRDFARRRLDEDERVAVREVHAGAYTDLAARAERGLLGGEQYAWLERLEIEYDNLRAALDWAVSGGHRVALRLAGSLIMFWRLRGRWNEGAQWLRRSLEKEQDRDRDLSLQARALWGLSVLTGLLGDTEGASSAGEASLALYGDLGDEEGSARAHNALALLWAVEHSPKSLVLAEQAVGEARRAEDAFSLAEALALAGQAQLLMGHADAARSLYEESLEVARSAGDLRAEAAALIGCAATSFDQAAESGLEEGLSIARRLGGHYEVAEALMYLGNRAVIAQRLDRAQELLEECLTLAQEIGSPFFTARALGGLGRLHLARRQAGTAAFFFDEAISIAKQGDFNFVLARALFGRAQAAALQGDEEGAIQLWNEVVRVAEANSDNEGQGTARLFLAVAALQRADDALAGRHAHRALVVAHESANVRLIGSALVVLAGVNVAQGRLETAARLFGAVRSLDEPVDTAPPFGTLYKRDIAALRDRLGRQDFAEALRQGEDMSLDDIVAYASRGRGTRAERAATGWASLTKAERHVVDLVAEGLTSREIAERLFISPRTVGTHLTHIFAKMGVSSRNELARRASARNGADEEVNDDRVVAAQARNTYY